MTIEKNGYVVVMASTPSSHILYTRGGLFGPTTSWENVDLASENLCTNGLEVFPDTRLLKLAISERRTRFSSSGLGIYARKIELSVAETREDWESLRDFGSYVVAVGENLRDCTLFGSAWVNGQRVEGAHDYWADFYTSGFTPFTDFSKVVGETSLGVLSELARQSQERVRLIGLRFGEVLNI